MFEFRRLKELYYALEQSPAVALSRIAIVLKRRKLDHRFGSYRSVYIISGHVEKYVLVWYDYYRGSHQRPWELEQVTSMAAGWLCKPTLGQNLTRKKSLYPLAFWLLPSPSAWAKVFS